MKQLKKLLILLPIVALASCDFPKSTFFGQTFTYQSAVCYNLSSATNNYGVAIDSIIQQQMSADNVDWSASGYVNEILFVTTVTPFAKHSSWSEVTSEMESSAKAVFDKAYKDFKLEIGAYDASKASSATLTYNGSTKTLTAKAYSYGGTADEEADEVRFYDGGEDSVGSISLATYNGNGWVNGKITCALFQYDVKSRVRCVVTFKNAVTLNSKSVEYLDWYVYAKIAN